MSDKQKEILKRSQSSQTASNYSDAVDQNTWIGTLNHPLVRTISTFIPGGMPIAIRGGKAGDDAVQAADYVSNFIFGKKKIPTAQSNCTLTASQWVNPKIPISRAETILKDGRKYGYIEIPESHLLSGDLVIATNPSNNAHHTMLVSGFTKNQQNHTFQGKDYVLPPDHPIVRYSNGTTHPSGYRRSVGLMEYIDNSDGKTDLKYYRHFKPGEKEVLLPEIVVTPNENYIPEGQKVIRVNSKGGVLSRQNKLDILKQSYRMDSPESELIPVIYPTRLETYSKYPPAIDSDFDYYINQGHGFYSPLKEGVTVTEYVPLRLETYYPIVHPYYNSKFDSPYKWTGHSAISGIVSKDSDEDDYNLVTNNCSDATREYLEAIFNKKLDYNFFTTPGDVRDFALQNGGKQIDNRTIIIPMNKERYDRLRKFKKTKRKYLN